MDENRLKERNQDLLQKFELMVKVDTANLSDEMAKNSARMFKINSMKADAEYLKDKAELRIKVLESFVDRQVRKSSKKKLTEQQIKQRIVRHPKVREAHDRYFEAKWKFNTCWAAASSIAQKGDQLTNLANNYRKELDHGMKSRVKKINASAEQLVKKGRVQRGGE